MVEVLPNGFAGGPGGYNFMSWHQLNKLHAVVERFGQECFIARCPIAPLIVNVKVDKVFAYLLKHIDKLDVHFDTGIERIDGQKIEILVVYGFVGIAKRLEMQRAAHSAIRKKAKKKRIAAGWNYSNAKYLIGVTISKLS